MQANRKSPAENNGSLKVNDCILVVHATRMEGIRKGGMKERKEGRQGGRKELIKDAPPTPICYL